MILIEWYKMQYQVQHEKGGHLDTNLSEDECLRVLFLAIQEFRGKLNFIQRETLKKYFIKSKPIYKVGCLKLVPKIHKEAGAFDEYSWKTLPARTIRGRENCPINGYSKSLCSLLQELHLEIKQMYIMGKLGQNTEFPIIYGCDEFSDKINKISVNKENWNHLTLISGDFSDAYTESRLIDLEGSILYLATFVGWTSDKIKLAQTLAKLVFENCYFLTPCGILKQTKGFPMGGHSSRIIFYWLLKSKYLEQSIRAPVYFLT